MVQPLFLRPLFSVVGKEFSVPWVVFREKGGMRRGEGKRFKSQRRTGTQEAELQQITILYHCFSLGDVTALPRRPIKVNDRGLFSHQSSSMEDFESAGQECIPMVIHKKQDGNH